jgi:hypothetical protein
VRAEQGYVHLPMTAGSGDGLTITVSEREPCARCGGHGGDMIGFTYTPERCGCLAPGSRATLYLHVACMEALMYMYRTGRTTRPQYKGG